MWDANMVVDQPQRFQVNPETGESYPLLLGYFIPLEGSSDEEKSQYLLVLC
jgi:hypothetical protein